MFDTVSSKVFYYLDSLNREIAFTMKPRTLKMVPMFADVDVKTLSTYIARWKKKKPNAPKPQIVEKTRNSTYVKPKTQQFDDVEDSGNISPEAERIFNQTLLTPDTIPTEITTELIEKETLNQYYLADDPKDKQRLLSIMQSIWAVKHKVPTENTNKTQSMEDLLARLS